MPKRELSWDWRGIVYHRWDATAETALSLVAYHTTSEGRGTENRACQEDLSWRVGQSGMRAAILHNIYLMLTVSMSPPWNFACTVHRFCCTVFCILKKYISLCPSLECHRTLFCLNIFWQINQTARLSCVAGWEPPSQCQGVAHMNYLIAFKLFTLPAWFVGMFSLAMI